jgi:hypothetical protein
MESVQSHSNSWIGRFDEMAEFNRYGIMSIGLLLLGCSGGAVVGMFGFDTI